jgi:hypothetical protein
MKNTNWIITSLFVGVLALAGCGKKQPAGFELKGVTVDLPKLESAFATASPDLQNIVPEVTMGVRYADYPRAFAALAKLDSAPGLTDAQKKAVAEVAEQIKQLSTKAPPPTK